MPAEPPDDERLFAQLRREPRLPALVEEQLLELIRSGRLPQGSRLPSERELGEQFGVSRTVIREAVLSLVGRGMLGARPGGGLEVTAVDPRKVSESLSLLILGHTSVDYGKVHQVRTMLEGQAARLAAARATPEDIAAMRASLVAMEQATAPDEMAVYDIDFHRAVARATHNELFLILHDSIGDALLTVRKRNLGAGGRDEALASHARILESIEAGRGTAAEQGMLEHLRAVAVRAAAHPDAALDAAP